MIRLNINDYHCGFECNLMGFLLKDQCHHLQIIRIEFNNLCNANYVNM